MRFVIARRARLELGQYERRLTGHALACGQTGLNSQASSNFRLAQLCFRLSPHICLRIHLAVLFAWPTLSGFHLLPSWCVSFLLVSGVSVAGFRTERRIEWARIYAKELCAIVSLRHAAMGRLQEHPVEQSKLQDRYFSQQTARNCLACAFLCRARERAKVTRGFCLRGSDFHIFNFERFAQVSPSGFQCLQTEKAPRPEREGAREWRWQFAATPRHAIRCSARGSS